MLKKVFQSTLPSETEIVRGQLEGAGFHPAVIHGGSSSLNLVVGGIASEVQVPEAEFEAVRRYLLDSKLVFDETLPAGVIAEGSVCPVHEQPAVATCDRCGTFLCKACGSLGNPPLCEDCVKRPEPPRERSRWATHTARVWFGVWVGLAVLAGLGWLFVRLGGR